MSTESLGGIIMTKQALLSCAKMYTHQFSPGHPLVEAGAYLTNLGESQKTNINGLIGAQYNVSEHDHTSPSFGFGYRYLHLDDGYVKQQASHGSKHLRQP